MSQKLGKYEILEKLASTRKGVIYKGQDPAIGRVVAIKTIGELGTELSRSALEHLQQEARAAGNLRHPNIVTIFDADISNDPPYLVMDYIDGTTLQSLMQIEGRMNPERVLSILKQIAEGIDFAHQQGILHRDIKPGNIMLDHQDRAFILDFGLAVLESSDLASGAMIVGTPAYMSPEQVLNRQLDAASDLFSLAVVAYQMFTGRLPFQGGDYQAIMQSITSDPPHNFERRMRLPGQLEVQLQRGLNKDPRRRFSSAAELVSALEGCFPSEVKPKTKARPSESKGGKSAENLTGEPVAAENVYVHKQRTRGRMGIKPVEILALGLLILGAILLMIVLLNRGKTAEQVVVDQQALIKEMAQEEKVDFTKQDQAFTDNELIAALVSPEKTGTRLQGILAEAWKRKLPWLLEASLPLITHSQKQVRLTTIEILGAETHPEAAKALVSALEDKELEVAIAAAKALEFTGSLMIVPALKAKYKELNLPEHEPMRQALKTSIEKIQGYPLSTE